MPTSIGDLVAAVRATNAVITDPSATQKDLEAAAEAEHETVSAYLEESHAGAQLEAQAESRRLRPAAPLGLETERHR